MKTINYIDLRRESFQERKRYGRMSVHSTMVDIIVFIIRLYENQLQKKAREKAAVSAHSCTTLSFTAACAFDLSLSERLVLEPERATSGETLTPHRTSPVWVSS